MIMSARDLLNQAAENLSIYLASCQVLPDGTVIRTKAQITRVGGVIIEVYSKEHAPPHFHVRYSGKNAAYRIDNCERLEGSLGTNEDKIVKYWFKKEGKDLLIDAWNKTRPGDCSVGKYEE